MLMLINAYQMIMDKKWILHRILSNGGGRTGGDGICVLYLKCRGQGKLSSWNSCGQAQTSGTSHSHKSGFSSISWMAEDT